MPRLAHCLWASPPPSSSWPPSSAFVRWLRRWPSLHVAAIAGVHQAATKSRTHSSRLRLMTPVLPAKRWRTASSISRP
eukprot:7261515-Alexandrium_andersonii.AAC.1